MRTSHILLAAFLLATFPELSAKAGETHSFTNINKLIPDGSFSGLSDVRSITSSVARLSSVRVKLHIEGQFNGDLYGYLRHQQTGRTDFCVLLNRPGRTATNSAGYADCGLNLVFDASATNGDIHVYRLRQTPAPGAALTGDWQPDGRKVDPTQVTDAAPRTTSLSSFAGAAASGEWTLYLADLDTGGTNLLKSWELEFTGMLDPELTWTIPADITYGTALGPAQLNAAASVEGSYTYTPPAGTILNAGATQTLTVVFVPNDTVTYVAATNTVPLNVLRKNLTITATSTNKVYGAPLPALAATYNGFVNDDTPASLDTPLQLTTTATAGSPVGSYAITPANAADANYAITFVPGTLSIIPATTAGALVSSANPARPGQTVTFTFTLNAIAPGAGTPDGTVQFKIDGANAGAATPLVGGAAIFSTSTLAVGLHTVMAEYGGSLNFRGATNQLSPAQMINTPPVAGPDAIDRWPTNGTKVEVITLLANDSDADGDSISLWSFSTNSTGGGSLSLSNGWLYYVPAPGYTNVDSFTYTIQDGRGGSAVGTVTINLKPANVPSSNVTLAKLDADTYRIRVDGIPGITYRIEYTENLQSPVWNYLGSGTANDFGYFEYEDTPPPGAPERFYRAVYP